MYDAVELSKYIIAKCIDDNCPISNLQLQKILYYIQKFFLVNNSLAFSDNIEAWQFGPVVPNSYYKFCGFGSMPITIKHDCSDICIDDKKNIDQLIISKRQMDPWELVEETHKSGGAWDQIYKNGLGNHQIIPIELIKEYG